MSSEMELFFTGYFDRLCRREFRKNVYIAYSGGDDLFVDVGPGPAAEPLRGRARVVDEKRLPVLEVSARRNVLPPYAPLLSPTAISATAPAENCNIEPRVGDWLL